MLDILSEYYYKSSIPLINNKKLSKAIDMLRKSVFISNSNWKALDLLGLIYYRYGAFEEAKECWVKSYAIYSAPENSAKYYIDCLNDIDFINTHKKYEAALSSAKAKKFKTAESILTSPDFDPYYSVKFANLLGLCKYSLGKKHEALNIWSNVLFKIDKENAQAIRYIALASDDLNHVSPLKKLYIRLKDHIQDLFYERD